MKRIKALRVSPEALLGIFKQSVRSFRVIADPVPEDAEIVDVKIEYEFGAMVVLLTLSSEEFPEIADGTAPQPLVPLLETIPEGGK